jgi:DNA-binding transcriptional regulator YdaS (Cro superfamily)
MRLSDYLAEQEESQSAFARRAGISQQVVASILSGAGCHNDTAVKIVRATGGLVTHEDLRRDQAA